MSIFRYRIKTSPTDFNESKLPHTRRQQYWDLLKNRFSTILLTGFWLLVFFVPCFILIVLKDSYNFYVISSGLYEGEEITKALASVKLIYFALLIFGFAIFALGLSAALKIFRRLIWNEPLFYKHDFLLGIEDNFPHILISTLLVGILSFLSAYIDVMTKGIGNVLISIPQGVNLVIIYPIFYVMTFITAIYKNPYGKNLKIALSLCVRTYFFNLIPCLIIHFIFYLRFIENYLIKYIAIAIVILFLSPVILLGFWESQIYVIDKYINRHFYPNYYLKGLYKFEAKTKGVKK